MSRNLAVIETHPIQYHAPIYRTLQQRFGVPVTAIYGSDFSVVGYRDSEFGTEFAWDTDLLSGYSSVFLSRVQEGGARTVNEVSADGLRRILQQINPAAVMIVGYSPGFHREAFWAAWRGGYPILFRGETTDHTQQRSPLKRWARDSFLRWFYGRCAALLYVGRRSLAHYRRLAVPEHKLFFSPYCVDTTPFQTDEEARKTWRPACRAELGVAGSDRVLLFSGKLIPQKAPELVLQAVKRLPPDMRERTIVLYLGDGALRASLETLAKQEPRVRVRLVGFQNQRALSRYYHAADLLVLPSWGETWGLVVNEALHHGVPCVVSDAVGCAPDLIEPGVTGEVFRSGSAEALASTLLCALQLVDREDIRKKCRAKVARYTIEEAARGIAEAFWSIRERQGGTGRRA